MLDPALIKPDDALICRALFRGKRMAGAFDPSNPCTQASPPLRWTLGLVLVELQKAHRRHSPACACRVGRTRLVIQCIEGLQGLEQTKGFGQKDVDVDW